MRTKKVLHFPVAILGIFLAFVPLGAQVTAPAVDAGKPPLIRIGGNVQRPKIVSQVPPVYPPEAKQAHVQGNVVLHAIIGADGAVRTSTVVSGDPLLTQSAQDAVKQWRYEPTLLNGKPVEVDTNITVTYKPSDAGASTGTAGATLDTFQGSPNAGTSATGGAQAGGDASGSASADIAEARKAEAKALAAVDPETAADIRKLLAVTNAQGTIALVFDSQLPVIKDTMLKNMSTDDLDTQALVDKFIKKMQERVNSGELVELIVPVYAKHFTHEDIKSMIAFFDSPAGRRYIQESPAYLQDVQSVTAQHWQSVVVPELLEEFATQFQDLNIHKQ